MGVHLQYSLGGRLVADVEVSGARAAISPVEKPSQTAAMPTSMVASALKPSTSLRLQAWIEEAQQKLAIMVTNLSQLDDLMQQISVRVLNFKPVVLMYSTNSSILKLCDRGSIKIFALPVHNIPN